MWLTHKTRGNTEQVSKVKTAFLFLVHHNSTSSETALMKANKPETLVSVHLVPPG